MENLSVYVGNKIKFYRKLNGYSLAELADRIHKSKSTLSKYENGVIILDIETLMDLSRVFNISINQFFDFEEPGNVQELSQLSSCFRKGKSYIYYYDGRKKKIVKSFLTASSAPGADGKQAYRCSLYMDIDSFDTYENCDFFYIGDLSPFDLVTYSTLINQANQVERLGMCILNTLYHNTMTWGLMFGISYKPIAPFARKVLISSVPIPEKDLSKELMTLSSAELKMMKNLNMMLLNQ